VRAVIASSFERIHRSNLVGMGVLPCQFAAGTDAQSLNIKGDECFDLRIDGELRPQGTATLVIRRDGQDDVEVPLTLRIDTPIEVQYYTHGGILPYVLRQRIARTAAV
jgi:aconitate hydratase